MTFGILLVRTTLQVSSDGYHVFLSCFLEQISFALKIMICLSDAPCFGPRLEFFLMTKPGIEVKSQLAFWVVVGLRLYFHISPATAVNDPDF